MSEMISWRPSWYSCNVIVPRERKSSSCEVARPPFELVKLKRSRPTLVGPLRTNTMTGAYCLPDGLSLRNSRIALPPLFSVADFDDGLDCTELDGAVPP